MTDVLKQISNTPLEGGVKFVDITDQCTVCKEGISTYRYRIGRECDAVGACVVGFVHEKYCYNCQKLLDFVATKVVPSKDQND